MYSRLLALILVGGLLAGALLVPGPKPAHTAPGQDPDLVFVNGTILTLDGPPASWTAEALAVRGDSILAVGDRAVILAAVGPDARVIDLNGYTVMPGFVDAHTHLFNDTEIHLGLTLAEAQDRALSYGITTLADPFITPEFLQQMQAMDQAGDLRIRTSLYLIATDNCGNLQGDWWRDHPPTRERGEMLRINGIKIFLDGGTCQAPATSYDGDSGTLFHDQATVTNLIKQAQAEGHQVLLHAIGDRAVEQALDTLESVLAGQPNTYRHRVDHNSVVRNDQLFRYGEIGALPVVFGSFPFCDYAGPGPEYARWEWRWHDLLTANPDLPVAWHSDTPWAGTTNPFDHLYSLVTPFEVTPDGAECPTPAYLQAKRLTLEQALPMMTSDAAYMLFREDAVGMLTPGKLADLIVVSDNPLTVDPANLRGLSVQMTLVGGDVVYCAPGADALCAVD